MSFDRPLAVIGLDCAEANLVFDLFRDRLPNFRRLMEQGSYGVLRTCHPPITIPAWACMTTSYDAGQMGYYGFRNRKDYTYSGLDLAFSNKVIKPRIWDRIGSELGKKVIVLGCPQTYPILPNRRPNGLQVTSFMTPSIDDEYTWPKALKGEIAETMQKTGHDEYVIDVRGFRTDDKDWLLKEIDEMTDARFDLAEHLVENHPWDFFWMVEMGTDRIHHGMWHCCDPNHPKFPGADNPYVNCILDYYIKIDARIGQLIDKMPDEARVLIVSDHGARPMFGGVAVNEWLIRKGWLVLHEYPNEPMSIEKMNKAGIIDWSKTKVWSEGGYYARIFMNVQGREPEGLIPQAEYETMRDEIIREFEAMPLAEPEDAARHAEYANAGPEEKRDIKTRVHRPEDLFKSVNRDTVPPDLICYFGNLAYRSVGTVGQEGGGQGPLYVSENDTGPDEANHDWTGILISSEPLMVNDQPSPAGAEVPEMRLLDVGASLMAMYGLNLPEDMAGSPRIAWAPHPHDGTSLRAGKADAVETAANTSSSTPASTGAPAKKKGLLKRIFGG